MSKLKQVKAPPRKRDIGAAVNFYPFTPFQSVEEMIGGGATAIAAGTARPSMLLRAVIPDDITERIRRCYEYAATDDLVSAIVFNKKNIFSTEFTIYALTDKDDLVEPDEQRALNRLLDSKKLQQTIDTLFEDWITCDNMVLCGQIVGRKLAWIHAARPDTVEYTNDFGSEQMALRLGDLRAIKRTAKDRYNSLPAQLKKLVDSGEKKLLLDPKQGYFFIVHTNGRNFEGLCSPRMTSIFFSIELRSCLLSGDFSNSFHMKRTILHYLMGETVQNQMGGLITGRLATDAKLSKVLGALKSTSQTVVIGTEHTGKFQYITLDPRVFSDEKYLAPEKRIMRWGFLNAPLIDGAGGNFASSLMGRDPLYADGRRAHRDVAAMVRQMLLIMNEEGVEGMPKNAVDFLVQFDHQSLKDPNVLLREQTAFYDRNLIDSETVLRESGRVRELIKRGKLRDLQEQAEDGLWQQRPVAGGFAGRPTETITGKPSGGVRPANLRANDAKPEEHHAIDNAA